MRLEFGFDFFTIIWYKKAGKKLEKHDTNHTYQIWFALFIDINFHGLA